MCDYSLKNLLQKPAQEGDDLATYRFSTGAIGFTYSLDASLARRRNPLAEILICFGRPRKEVYVVCIPPGAILQLIGIPKKQQILWNVSATEEVILTQLPGGDETDRDAVKFRNGRIISLQDFPSGQQASVLDLSHAEESLNPLQEDVPAIHS